MRYAAAAIVGTGLLAGTAHAATEPQVWQGTAFIKTVSSACTTANVVAVGSEYVTVYRPIIAGSAANTGNEALSFQTPRSLQQYYTPSGSNQSLRTAGTASISGVGSHASSFTATGTYALKFTPAAPALTTPQIYITGTLQTFWGVTGCTVSLTASLDLRIN